MTILFLFLTVVLAILKLAGALAISWLVVLLPIWLPLGLWMVFTIIIGAFFGIGVLLTSLISRH